jgi:hypothetical protein
MKKAHNICISLRNLQGLRVHGVILALWATADAAL